MQEACQQIEILKVIGGMTQKAVAPRKVATTSNDAEAGGGRGGAEVGKALEDARVGPRRAVSVELRLVVRRVGIGQRAGDVAPPVLRADVVVGA